MEYLIFLDLGVLTC